MSLENKILLWQIEGWMHRPITWDNEKVKLSLIAAMVLIILAVGTVSFFYVGGKYAHIPGYNQKYAYFMWTLGGTAVLATTAVYLAKAILSRSKKWTSVQN